MEYYNQNQYKIYFSNFHHPVRHENKNGFTSGIHFQLFVQGAVCVAVTHRNKDGLMTADPIWHDERSPSANKACHSPTHQSWHHSWHFNPKMSHSRKHAHTHTHTHTIYLPSSALGQKTGLKKITQIYLKAPPRKFHFMLIFERNMSHICTLPTKP